MESEGKKRAVRVRSVLASKVQMHCMAQPATTNLPCCCTRDKSSIAATLVQPVCIAHWG